MSTLIVPPLDEKPWPTLGPQICQFLEERSIFGPGDLRGQPYRLDTEKRAAVYRAYEVYPQDHPKAGRRRFKRVTISWRKGTAKTEWGAELVFAELHPEAPVRCDGFDASGNPVGRPVNDPYIPMVAYTEEQTEELAYGALYVIVSQGPDADLFDVGLERIMRAGGDGKAVALAAAPDSRDGARTTFQHFDETHRMTTPRLRAAHETMMGNLSKRPLSDPWSLSTTTAYEPGSGSVAEVEHDEAKLIHKGEVARPRLFFFHREASPGHDLTTFEGRVEAIREASGPTAEWSDLEDIAGQWDRVGADLAYLERVWLNRTVQSQRQAFNPIAWKRNARDLRIPDGATATLGFDGAKTDDGTALVATDIATGLQDCLGYWQRPLTLDPRVDWEVPTNEVDAAWEEAFERLRITRAYVDPMFWTDDAKRWQGRWGTKRVVLWETNRPRPIAYACQAYNKAIDGGKVLNTGDPAFLEHIGNTRKRALHLRDEQGKPLWSIEKDRPDSPNKIDRAMAGVLSWEARGDAVASGVKPTTGRRRAMVLT